MPVVIETPPKASSASVTRGCEPGVIVVEVKDTRVRIGADAPVALIAATLKALRS